eukprot:3926971-Rhodomonas_salina.2
MARTQRGSNTCSRPSLGEASTRSMACSSTAQVSSKPPFRLTALTLLIARLMSMGQMLTVLAAANTGARSGHAQQYELKTRSIELNANH